MKGDGARRVTDGEREGTVRWGTSTGFVAVRWDDGASSTEWGTEVRDLETAEDADDTGS